MSNVSAEPMQPVEDGTLGSARMRPEVRPERLDEAKHRRGDSQVGVRIRFAGPGLQFDEDQHEAGRGQSPRQAHEHAMPLKFLLQFYATL